MSGFKEAKPFGIYLDVTLKVIRQDLIRRFKEQNIDLTPEQWTVLSEIAKEEDSYQSDLAENTFKDPPTVSRIIELLNKRGYIERLADTNDRRRFLIRLTPEGNQIFNRANPVVNMARERGWEGLTEKDHENLSRILAKISSNILNGH